MMHFHLSCEQKNEHFATEIGIIVREIDNFQMGIEVRRKIKKGEIINEDQNIKK
ncbi:hypothetical protein B4122_0840 [Bacillus subtilis]|uniref:Uncharacterized protein n=1 Tax=Bacillus subtilis TaxID=1423 RepID=A0AAP1E7A6_BACIU|nr:hypothetical protein B4122_0840 [Bacillus subtilis]